MKRLLLSLFAVATLLFGATKVNLGDVRGLQNAPTGPYLVAFANGSWIPVIADPGGSIVIDTSGAVAILKASGAAVSLPVDVSEELTFTSTATFTTASIPKGIVKVYRNGLLQRSVADYTQTGAAGSPITVGVSNATSGDYITLVYQK